MVAMIRALARSGQGLTTSFATLLDMRNQAEAARSPVPFVPLARDPSGAPFAIPDDAVAWRVRRQTGGRPRLILDGNKQPMQLALSYTDADLEEILPPGAYRLDLVDASGAMLDVTVPVTIGGLRNAAEPLTEAEPEERFATAVGDSDIRFILEANVRSTQLAFAHNERMLASSLRVVDTLRDGVQSLANAQADWIKATAPRGFLRNGSMPQMQMVAPPAPAVPDDDDDDEEDDEDEEPAPPTMQSQLMEMATAVVPLIVTTVMDRFMKGGAAATTAPTSDTQPTNGFEARDLFDWRHAAKKAKKKRIEVIEVTAPAVDLAALYKEIPPALLPRVMQIWQSTTDVQRAQLQQFLPRLLQLRARLAPDEQQQLLPLVLAFDSQGLTAMATELERLGDDAVIGELRALLTKGASC